jgi:hypothetical protein
MDLCRFRGRSGGLLSLRGTRSQEQGESCRAHNDRNESGRHNRTPGFSVCQANPRNTVAREEQFLIYHKDNGITIPAAVPAAQPPKSAEYRGALTCAG